VAGIAAILAASAVAFTVLKVAGAVYLVYLGVTTLRRDDHDDRASGERPAGSLRTAAAQGLLSAGLNPKLGVFFLTLLPQFSGPTESPARSLELAVLFGAIGVAWLLVYTYVLGSVGHVLRRPAPRRAVRWVSGTVLIGLGARVALERS
jgi:threonine/homoserine/homoserine lactone efflux protein